jgi:hypothetical protein
MAAAVHACSCTRRREARLKRQARGGGGEGVVHAKASQFLAWARHVSGVRRKGAATCERYRGQWQAADGWPARALVPRGAQRQGRDGGSTWAVPRRTDQRTVAGLGVRAQRVPRRARVRRGAWPALEGAKLPPKIPSSPVQLRFS